MSVINHRRVRRRGRGRRSLILSIPQARSEVSKFLDEIQRTGGNRQLTMEEYITMEHLFFTETTPSFVAADAKRFVAAVKSNPETLGKIGDGIVTLWHQMHSKAQDRNHVMTRTIYRLMCYANQTLSPWEHNQEDENGS